MGSVVCIDCRVRIADGAACPWGAHHRVANLHDTAGREKLVSEVWGSKPVRAHLRAALKAGGFGTGLASLSFCSLCPAEFVGSWQLLGAVLLAGVALVALAFAYEAVRAAIHRRRHSPRPRGSTTPLLEARTRITGRVVEGDETASPIAALRGVAWGAELRSHDADPDGPMLRDGSTSGFVVALDDGRTLRVPAGALLVEGPPAEVETTRDRAAIARYLASVDPDRERERARAGAEKGEPAFDAVPADVATEIAVRSGDRVVVCTRTAAVPDDTDGYRGGARRLAATGAILVLLDARG